jgi:dTMP kinase
MIVALEGIDCSGKATQAQLLARHLANTGRGTHLLSFPSYNGYFGQKVRKYLLGGYGDALEVHFEQAALLYAMDRCEVFKVLDLEWVLKEGINLVCDRYVYSNVAYQAGKLNHEYSKEEREAAITDIEIMEFGVIGNPRPHVNIYLRAPIEVVESRLHMRGEPADQHEMRLEYLERVSDVYDMIAERNPGSWEIIPIVDDNGRELSVHELSEKITSISSFRLDHVRGLASV